MVRRRKGSQGEGGRKGWNSQCMWNEAWRHREQEKAISTVEGGIHAGKSLRNCITEIKTLGKKESKTREILAAIQAESFSRVITAGPEPATEAAS